MKIDKTDKLKAPRFKPWIYRWIPEAFSELDEDLVASSMKGFLARHRSKQFDRTNRRAIWAAIQKPKSNPVSRAMEEEVTRIVFRLGRSLLPLKTDRPVIYKTPPKDAFEDIASQIAIERIQTAMGISIGIRKVDANGNKSRITERSRNGCM